MDCLDPCFNYHLAQAENLAALFVALNDEVFDIREQTICIIGRLSFLNPAYIMPSLRMTLIKLLTEMECRQGVVNYDCKKIIKTIKTIKTKFLHASRGTRLWTEPTNQKLSSELYPNMLTFGDLKGQTIADSLLHYQAHIPQHVC